MAHSVPSYVIVLMGVAGSGKSTVGPLLAEMLGWPFRDADQFHPAANIAKMSAGVPLTDADRWPWLDAIAAWIDERRSAGAPGIVSCSALKRAYRRRILGAREGVRLVYLEGEEPLIAARLARRKGHFMPAALLRSQLDALEEPEPDERAIVVSIDATPAEIAAAIVAGLGLAGAVAGGAGDGRQR
jgi:gluconokinase